MYKSIFSFVKKHNKYAVNFDIRSIYEGHGQVTYRGVQAIKCPFDYVLYQMIVFKLKPDLIIEIGTNKGGSTLYLADLLNIIGKGVVHTIDIKRQSASLLKKHPRIKIFVEGWEKYDLKKASRYRKVLIIEDSSHTYKNTLDVMNKFAGVVTVGSYFIVEDGIIDELGMRKVFSGGPNRAIKEFLTTREDYVIDYSLCNFFGQNATFNTNGYLKKCQAVEKRNKYGR